MRVSTEIFALLNDVIRKLAHLTEYAIFALLFYASLEDTSRLAWRPRRALGCIIVAALYSFTDEFHQSFVAGRTASVIDCGIDTSGAFLGMLGLYGRERFYQLKNQRAAGGAEGKAAG